MKKDYVLLVIATLTLAELTLALVLAYRYYQKIAPTLQAGEAAAGTVGGLINLLTGKSTKP